MSTHQGNCPFCALEADVVLRKSNSCSIIRDRYPVSNGHTLIIPKRHAETYFDLTADEREDVQAHLEEERALILQTDNDVTGFNIGMNCGISAGQTVMHCHIHLIPRRDGDLADPRGGVRGVIPDKRIY